MRLGDGEQVLAFHSGWCMKAGDLPFRSRRIDHELRRLRHRKPDIASNHGNDGILQSTVVFVTLNHQGRAVLAASSVLLWGLQDDDIASDRHAVHRERLLSW